MGLLAMALLGVVISSARAEPAAQSMKIFILAGQSNCVGKGCAGDLPPELATLPPGVMLYQNSWGMKGWQPLGPYPSNPGQAKMYGCGDKMFGPEIAFGHEMRKRFPNDRIGIVKVCVGGTSVLVWSKDHGSPEWMRLFQAWGKDLAQSKPLYPQLTGDLRKALDSCGSPYKVCAFVWIQAEADSDNPETAKAWPGRVLQLHKDVAADIGYSPGIPLIVMSPHIHAMELQDNPLTASLRNGMKRASEEGGAVTKERLLKLAGLKDTLPRDIEKALKTMRFFPPDAWRQIEGVGIMNRGLRDLALNNANVTIVESDDLPTHENIHFTSAGLVELGRRLALAFQSPPCRKMKTSSSETPSNGCRYLGQRPLKSRPARVQPINDKMASLKTISMALLCVDANGLLAGKPLHSESFPIKPL